MRVLKAIPLAAFMILVACGLCWLWWHALLWAWAFNHGDHWLVTKAALDLFMIASTLSVLGIAGDMVRNAALFLLKSQAPLPPWRRK